MVSHLQTDHSYSTAAEKIIRRKVGRGITSVITSAVPVIIHTPCLTVKNEALLCKTFGSYSSKAEAMQLAVLCMALCMHANT